VYLIAANEWSDQNGLFGTPTTIVTDEKAVVTQVWVGAFIGESEREIASFFNTTLPGLLK
jgi:hypothetical protein